MAIVGAIVAYKYGDVLLTENLLIKKTNASHHVTTRFSILSLEGNTSVTLSLLYQTHLMYFQLQSTLFSWPCENRIRQNLTDGYETDQNTQTAKFILVMNFGGDELGH